MKVRRDIASIPLRSAAETWAEYKALITGSGSQDIEQLDAAASVMTSLITDEAFCLSPLTLTGVGSRLVAYLSYGQYALEAGESVDRLNWNPTAGDWRLYVPCPEEQFDWAKKTLASRAARVVVVRPEEEIREQGGNSTAKSATVEVNWEVVGQ